jgi:TPR repeat protein
LFINENNPEALFLLAKLHEEGYGVDRNIERAIQYIERSSKQGYSKASTKLAHYYYSGYSDEDFRFP